MIMFNLTFNSVSDVNSFAGIVGAEGLLNAYGCGTLDVQQRQMIKDAVNLANKTDFCIESFNDGDSIYEIHVHIDPDNIVNTCYVDTRGFEITLAELTENNVIESNRIIEAIKTFYDNRRNLTHLVGVNI